jgi:hypothetical protein
MRLADDGVPINLPLIERVAGLIPDLLSSGGTGPCGGGAVVS